MLKKSIIIFFLLLSKLISAQGFKVRHFPTTSSDNLGLYIEEKSPGKYFAGGFINDTIGGKADFRLCVMELNSTGQINWIKKYGSSKFMYLNNPFIARWFYKLGSNFMFTGCVYDSIVNKYIGVLIKFNANGDTLWQKKYQSIDTLEDVIPQRVTAGTDGGFLITGFFQHWGDHSRKLMLIKTDAFGNELWRKKIQKNNPNVQDGKAILQDSASKKIVIGGFQYINSNLDTYINFTICDSVGNFILNWAMSQGAITDLKQTNDKKIIACGRKEYLQTNAAGDNYNRAFAFKFDINNPYAIIWKIDGFDSLKVINIFNSIEELNDGSILFGGTTERIDGFHGNNIIRISKFDANSNLIWNKYYDYKINGANQDNNQSMVCLTKTSDGVMIGAIPSINNDMPNPFFFVKYDANGCDTTLAYCNTLLFDNVLQKENSLFTVFPNPAHDFIYLQFIGQQSKHLYKITITNCIGELQLNLNVNPSLQNNQIVNIGLLKSGIYLLQLWENDKMISTQKLIKN